MPQCPKCSGQLHELDTHEAVSMDFCSGCKGIWFDAGEAAAYFEMAEDLPELKTALQTALPTDFSCPKCQNLLLEVRFHSGADVMLDYCQACGGLFFDRGEVPVVEQIAGRLESPQSKVLHAMRHLKKSGYQVIGIQVKSD